MELTDKDRVNVWRDNLGDSLKELIRTCDEVTEIPSLADDVKDWVRLIKACMATSGLVVSAPSSFSIAKSLLWEPIQKYSKVVVAINDELGEE